MTTPNPPESATEAQGRALSDEQIAEALVEHCESKRIHPRHGATILQFRLFPLVAAVRALLAATPTDAARAPAPQDAQALREALLAIRAATFAFFKTPPATVKEAGRAILEIEMAATAALTQSAPQASPALMSPQEQRAAGESLYALWEASKATAAPLQPACPQCKGSGTMTATVGEGPDGWPQDFECNKCAGLGAIDAAPLQAEPEASGNAESGAWREMASAPLDGTLVRLLVQFDQNEIEDSPEPAATMGHCCDGEWNFVGWCWTHDEWTRGSGDLLGWMPMLDARATTATPAAREAGEALSEIRACLLAIVRFPFPQEAVKQTAEAAIKRVDALAASHTQPQAKGERDAG